MNSPLRKGSTFLGLAGALLALLPFLCEGSVEGICSNCHTMHSSQEGIQVAFTLDSSGQQVFQEVGFSRLLKTDCVGCHSSAGAETIVSIGETTVPIVFNLTEPTYPPDGTTTSTLAGGNFYWVVNGGDAFGHNVTGISGEDLRFPPTRAPGGIERTGDCSHCHGTLATPQSGCTGCHVPQHHAGSASVVAGRDDGWFRFLGSVMQNTGLPEPTLEGVTGIEDPTWEQAPLPDRHNAYQGHAGAYTNFLESGSISQKCAGCHSQFHKETVANSTWIRHPVEAAIPNAGEFGSFTTYDPLAPVARPTVESGDVNFTAIEHGSDLVSCLSCHRPHGSPYPAMLRWGYRDWPGIDSHTEQPAVNGCAVCHTAKG